MPTCAAMKLIISSLYTTWDWVYYMESNRKFKRKTNYEYSDERDEVRSSLMIRKGSPRVSNSPRGTATEM